jgi:TIR domain
VIRRSDGRGSADSIAYYLRATTPRELTIFWIPVKDSEWNESPIGNILSATRSTIPLDSLNSTEQFRALERVYHSILNHLGLGPRDDFDVFMCHNTKDKPEVERIALQLKHRGLRPWLDKWQLRPGFPWQRVLEDQIKMIGAAAVFVGSGGMGPWQQLEQEGFLRQFVKRACPVIPVILPGVQQEPALPNFLEGMGWVDFRESVPDPLDSLIFGITGSNPHL